MQRKHLPELDALRGLAACGVAFLWHFELLSGTAGGPLSDVPGFGWFYRYGDTLVDLFFVLSGFVISHVYFDRGQTSLKEGVSARTYMVARIARLYPLHVAMLLAAAMLLAVPAISRIHPDLPYDSYHFFLNLLFLQRSGLEVNHSFNIPAWSLTAEMAAYVAFFLIARRFPRSFPVAFQVLILLVVVALTLGLINPPLARGLLGFSAGALLWWFYPTVERLPIVALAGGLIAGFWFTFHLIGSSERAYVLASFLVWPAAIALSLTKPFSALLSVGPLQWLGTLSYSVYLIHYPLYYLRPLLFGPAPLPPEYWGVVNLASAAFILGLAHLSHRYFEMPARHAVRRFALSQSRLVPA